MNASEQNKTVEKIRGILNQIGDTSDLNESVELAGELQQQLSNGNWANVEESRVDYFLELCGRQAGIDRNDVISALNDGKKMRNSASDWYSNCRIKPEPIVQKKNRPAITCKRCGQTGQAGSYPFSTFAGSGICDDCF